MAKIMVVDDELFYREMVREILEKDGHQVVGAANAREALELIKQGKPDLALVDIVLPGSMDGLTLLFKIKTQYSDVPVMMLSAYEDKKLILTALRRGAFDYLMKPISGAELKRSVERALEHYQLLKEREEKLSRLSRLEEGAEQLAHYIKGRIKLEELANAYEILESTVELVSQVLGCERVSIMLIDPGTNSLRVVVSKGMSKALIKKESKEPKKSASAWVLENKQALLVKDLSHDDRFQAFGEEGKYKTNSFVIAPLMVGGEIVGTINANDKFDGQIFSEEDLMFLKTFSHQVALTLQYLQLISELEREKKQLGMLVELEKILLEERDPNFMLKRILKKCQEMLDTSHASIYLKDEFTGELMFRVGWEGTKELKVKHRIQLNQSATGKVAGEGKSIIINRLEQAKFFSPEIEWSKGFEIKNYMATPIWIGDQVMGVIRLMNRVDGVFRKSDLPLLEAVARSLGIALRNLELYIKLERSVDETIQVNQMLLRSNQELQMKTRELEALRSKGRL